jgi:diguanylate cyclase (GGDEF)-like protein
MIKFLIETKGGRTIVTLPAGAVTIGRDSDNTVKLDDHDVSRHHCKLEPDGSQGWLVSDLDSTNGTFVNGSRIEETRSIQTTDRLTIGKFTLRVLTQSPTHGATVLQKQTSPAKLIDAEDGSFTDADDSEVGEDPLESTRRFIKDRLLRLNLATQSVASGRDLERLLGAILDVVLDFTGFERALFLFAEEGELRPALARNMDHTQLAAEEQTFSRRVIHAALTRRDGTLVRDSDKDIGGWNATTSWETLGLKCAMCLPLETPLLTPGAALAVHPERRRTTGAAASGLLGAIYLDSKWDVRVFGAQDRHLLRSVAAQAAIALQNARLYRLASQDSLTKLMTRFYFEQFMQEELANAIATRSPSAVIMLDIDHFKAVNDTHGHQVGDRVLAEVARRIRENVRSDDLVGRYGGEEFSFFLRGATSEGAEAVAAKLRDVIRGTPVSVNPRVDVTVSLGIALAPEHGDEPTLLVKRADQALYAAKKRGRDRTTVWVAELDLPGHRMDPLAGIVSGNAARDQQHLRLLLEMIGLCRRPTGKADDLARILDLLRELMRSDRAALFSGGHPSSLQIVHLQPESPGVDRAKLRATVAQAPVNEKTVCLAHLEESGEMREMRAVMCVPLIDGEHPFGVLYVDAPAEKRAFNQADIVLFEAVAIQLASALAADSRFRGGSRKFSAPP